MEGIHRWTKEGRLTKRKKLNDVFDALMVIVRGLILKWERLDTRVTTGSFRSRHETAQQIFPMPYEAMKDRLTTWGRDEAAHQMVLSFGYGMKRLQFDAYEALARPVSDNCPDSTRGVGDLLEFDLPPTMVTPAANAIIFEVSRQGTNVAHYVQLSGPVQTSVGLPNPSTYTLYRDLVCTCAFPTTLGMPCSHFWRVLRNDAFAAFHLGLVHSQYFFEDPPMHEELELMSRNVVGKLYHNHECVGPCPVEAPSVEGIVPEGEGEAALLVRQGEVQRIRNRLQLSALAREFVEVAIVLQERFEDARCTLRTWIDTQRKPLGELKADNPAKPPTKAQKRKASEMATGGKKKKKNTAEPDVPPHPPPPPQVYVTPPFVPPFVPVYPQVPLAPQPMHEEGSDDVVMLRRVPPPLPHLHPPFRFHHPPVLPVCLRVSTPPKLRQAPNHCNPQPSPPLKPPQVVKFASHIHTYTRKAPKSHCPWACNVGPTLGSCQLRMPHTFPWNKF